jgi:hypothetical protein
LHSRSSVVFIAEGIRAIIVRSPDLLGKKKKFLADDLAVDEPNEVFFVEKK